MEPEWLTESKVERKSESHGVDDSHLPEWLREATQEQPTATSKKPKKKLVYKAPTRRDSNDRSSFSGPIADSGSRQTSAFSNPIPSFSPTISSRSSHPVHIPMVSAPLGTVAAFSPQKSYQAIPDDDLELNLNPPPSSSSAPHRHSHQPSAASVAEDGDESVDDGRSPSSDALTWWFRAFHVTAGLCAVICMVGNIYDVAEWSTYGLRSAVLHLYAAAFSIVIVGVECEVPFLLHRLKILDWWVVRGLLYLFVGCLTVDPPDDFTKRSAAQTNMTLAQNIAAAALSLTAVLYVLMGLLCMKQIRDRRLAHISAGEV